MSVLYMTNLLYLIWQRVFDVSFISCILFPPFFLFSFALIQPTGIKTSLIQYNMLLLLARKLLAFDGLGLSHPC